MELLKLLSANELVAQIINFLLLLFLLRRFFWKNVLNLLDERRARISAELKDVATARADVARQKTEYEDKLGAIEEVAKKKINEAQAAGRAIAEQIKKEAQGEAERIISRAEADIAHELAKAKEQIKGEIVDLTIDAAQDLLGDKLTETDDKKLVEEFLKNIDTLERK